jgi:hypothetical protein
VVPGRGSRVCLVAGRRPRGLGRPAHPIARRSPVTVCVRPCSPKPGHFRHPLSIMTRGQLAASPCAEQQSPAAVTPARRTTRPTQARRSPAPFRQALGEQTAVTMLADSRAAGDAPRRSRPLPRHWPLSHRPSPIAASFPAW